MILSGDESLKKWLIVNLKAEVIKEIEALRDECQLKVKEPLSLLINKQRLNIAGEIADKVLKKSRQKAGSCYLSSAE